MLFPDIYKLSNKTEKNLFTELVKVYTSIVHCFSGYDKTFGDCLPVTTDTITELNSIGIIKRESDIAILPDILGKQLYTDLLNCVNFTNSHLSEVKPYLYKIRECDRFELQSKQENKPGIIDFFCGAGGLSLGFVQEGYKILLANDIQDTYCQTYRYNHPELKEENVVIGNIVSVLEKYKSIPGADLVIGGPPCQGFSTANQQKLIDDPRNHLYKYFIRAIQQYAPKFVVMENVKGMLKVAEQVVDNYAAINVNVSGISATYLTDFEILNAKDFSVPQNRERLIYIAIRSDMAKRFDITPRKIFDMIKSDCAHLKSYILNDAIGTLPPLSAQRQKHMNEVDSDRCGRKISLNNAIGQTANEYISLINSLPNRNLLMFNHKSRYVNDINYEIFRRLEQGEDSTNKKISDIMPYPHRSHCFKDKYYKLIANKPSRTITAHLKMDGLSHIHPYQTRSITPREAARIQSFPDDYLFLGPYLTTFMQIGNAVPPLMARGIARALREYL